jgi:hypothetical protein
VIKEFIEQLRNNEKNKVYGYLVALAFMALAIVLAILTPDFNILIKTTIGLLILIKGSVLRCTNPIWQAKWQLNWQNENT